MGVAPGPGGDQPQQGLKPGLTGWVCSDSRYDYDYAPRLEHFFFHSEISYCGSLGLWSTNPWLVARRRCTRCVAGMIRDGLLKVSGRYW